MINIPEHNQRTAMMLEGKRVTGYRTVDGVGNARIDVVNSLGLWEESHIVDPATVEPVRVRPIEEKYVWKCPNCGRDVKGIGVHCHMNYCPDCGQALDWSDATKTCTNCKHLYIKDLICGTCDNPDGGMTVVEPGDCCARREREKNETY